MKILHVVNISFVIPFFLGEQLNYFVSKGYKEYVVCSPSNELEAFAKRYEFENHPTNVLRRFSLASDIKAIAYVYNLIRRERIDVVNGHTPKGALIAMIASYIARIPKRIYFRHGLVFETSKGPKRWVLKTVDILTAKLATRIVNVSPSLAKICLEEKLNPANKQVLLSAGTCNGIDTFLFSRDSIIDEKLIELRSHLNIKKDSFVVGYAGRLVRDKGIVELVQAFLVVKESCPNLKLMLVGMLEERDALPRDIVDIIKNNKDIINVGYVSHYDMPYFYAVMDVFVLPSYREGFPTSILEASSMQLPVITTNVTGCRDAIIEGESGLFVNHSSEDIGKAIKKLYDKPTECAEIGRKGRLFVTTYFQQKIVWDEIEKMYNS